MDLPSPAAVAAKRKALLDTVDSIGEVLSNSGGHSEELGTLAPEAVKALRDNRIFQLKLPEEVGGLEADAVTEMMVLERLAYYDLSSAWATMVGATGVASMGAFLPQSGLDKVFGGGKIPTAAISFFPAGRAKREGKGFRVSGRWRFNSGVKHSEWVLGGTIVEGTEAENGGKPIVMFSCFPVKDVTFYENWGDVIGLKGTGSIDFSVENYALPEDLTFIWDLNKPKPRRGGASYLVPPFSYVAKEHANVAIGAARRVLDELIKIATTTRGTFRSSSLGDRQTVQYFIGRADLRLRAMRALMHERYTEIEQNIAHGILPDDASIADTRAMAVYATEFAIETATNVFHFAGNTGLRHPHVIGRVLRDLNVAGLHQVMSDTAFENHGRFRLGLPTDAMS
jgi:alkylation response protein AidB-like acyl-CoA dehydrogenase